MQTFTLSKDINSPEFTFPRVIGLTGPKGMGKTTFANRIGGQILSLSTPIKKMLEHIIPKLYIYEEKEKQIPDFPDGMTGRVLMQRLGTEFGRECNPLIWVNYTREKIKDYLAWADATDHYNFRVIVDDIRFANEALMITELGGEIWKISRSDYIPQQDSHSSEDGLPEELIDKEIIVDDYKGATTDTDA